MDLHERIVELNNAVIEGVALINDLVKQVGGILQELESMQDEVCGKELCSAKCDSDLHCHDPEHLKLAGDNKFCCVPVEPN